jgi:PAS domain S-box-containing protein
MPVNRDIQDDWMASEAALAKSEAKYKSLFNTLADGVFLIRDDGSIADVNEGACQQLGYSREELLSRNLRDISTKSINDLQEIKRNVHENGRVFYETVHRHKDGTLIPIELSISNVDLGEEKIYVGIAHDITVRNNAEAFVRAERNLGLSLAAVSDLSEGLQMCLDTALKVSGMDGGGIYLVDPIKGLGLTVHKGFSDVFVKSVKHFAPGVPHFELVMSGKTLILSGIGKADSPEERLARECRLEGLKAICAVPIKARDEVVACLNAASYTMDYFAPQSLRALEAVAAHIGSIIARLRAEDLLRASEEKYRELVQNANSIILRMDTLGNVTFFNEFAQRFFGYSETEILGRNVVGTIVPKTDSSGRDLKQMILDIALNPERYTRNENENTLRDGKRVWISWTNKLLLDPMGKVREILCVGNDITRRKQMEDERERLQAQLIQAQKMESVGRLAGGVAHDFNNMLGVILGHAEMALDQVNAAHALHADLLEICKAAKRSADLTRQLLAFARKQTASPKVLDLNQTISSMLKMLQRLIGEDINLTWEPKENLWPVNMDPSQIDQILANLCVNARDAISGVGRIIIQTNNVTIDEAFCADRAEFVPGQYVMVVVIDDGCGMDDKALQHIFEPFFTTKDLDEGTGLGLATVYGIVQQNNGLIEVQSEVGRGSIFRTFFPRHRGGPHTAETHDADQTLYCGQETVLLVEDEPTLLNLGKNMLEKLGYKVLAANTPNDAIRLSGEFPGSIHLLLTDVVMPDMNGRDLAVMLKFGRPEMKHLFMSGYTADVIAHHGLLENGIQYLQKPFSMTALAAKVREVLDRC